MRIRRTVAAGAAAAALTLFAALPASADGPAASGPLNAGNAGKAKVKVKIFEQPKFQGRYTVLTHGVRNLPAAGWDHVGFNVVTRSPGYPVGGQAAIR
ncbi:hypothetical protein ACFVZM_28485 [Streptomyces sioyaensis]|uniref:hypothetical protein n=1 Tax=Streptomyces sioyaensis TaxID=67364 RepID=UPI0036AE4E78